MPIDGRYNVIYLGSGNVYGSIWNMDSDGNETANKCYDSFEELLLMIINSDGRSTPSFDHSYNSYLARQGLREDLNPFEKCIDLRQKSTPPQSKYI